MVFIQNLKFVQQMRRILWNFKIREADSETFLHMPSWFCIIQNMPRKFWILRIFAPFVEKFREFFTSGIFLFFIGGVQSYYHPRLFSSSVVLNLGLMCLDSVQGPRFSTNTSDEKPRVKYLPYKCSIFLNINKLHQFLKNR